MADNTTVFDAADDYERFMGRWSRAIGEKFLAWLDAPANARWLDVGCGTGAFSELIAKRCAPASLTGIDPSPEQIAYAREHFPALPFRGRRLDGHAVSATARSMWWRPRWSSTSSRIARRPSPR